MELTDHRGTRVPQPRQYRSAPVRPHPAAGAFPRLSPSIVRLKAEESETMRRLAGAIEADPREDPDAFCEEAALQAKRLPDSIWARVRPFARFGSRTGFLVIAALPVEAEVPPTPADNTKRVGESTITARVQAIVNAVIGEQVAYEVEGGGALFQDMVPNRKAVDTQTSSGSRVELECHTEQTFSEIAPDVLSLACLRGAVDAKTYVFSARYLVKELSAREEALLREPLWTTTVDESIRGRGIAFVEGDLRGPFPVLTGPADDPLIRFDYDLGWGMSEEAHALHERIGTLYLAHRGFHVLMPGEILLLDNRRAIHGRSPFEATFDGLDRFILRSFVVKDLTRSRHARAGDRRVIEACRS